MPLDNRTLIFSLMLASTLMAAALAAVAQGGRRDGLGQWAAAKLLEALAWLLILARGAIPDVASIVLANTLMVAVYALMLAAIHEHRGAPWPRWQCLLPAALMPVIFWFLLDDYRGRVVWGSLIYGGQLLLIARALLADREGRAGRAWRLLLGTILAMLPVLVLRMGAILFGGAQFALPNSEAMAHPMQMVVYAAILAADILGTMGFVLMTKERADRDIRALAMTDALTGVFNRRALMEQAEKEQARARRSGLPLSLLMIDVDHFKRINDTHGHVAGDQALAGAARLLASRLRRQDTLGRYGGEEFCVLAPDTDAAGAHILAESLRAAVAAAPVATDHGPVPLTVSIGISVCPATCDDCEPDLGKLLDAADSGLYQAKRDGRNRAVLLSTGCPLATV